MIVKQIPVAPMRSFCYLLACEKTREAVVIDPCGDEAVLFEIIRELELSVRLIINTHGHPDHVCGNGAVKERTGAQIVMHEQDNAFFGLPEIAEYYRRFGLPPSPPPDRLVRDEELLSFGGHVLRVIHTPGHTPGGICLYGEGQLFSGDSLFVGAAGRVDLPGGDFNTLISSLAAKIATLPEETVVWPGHDYGDTPTSTIGREKKTNPFLGGEWE